MSTPKSFKRWIALALCFIMALSLVIPTMAKNDLFKAEAAGPDRVIVDADEIVRVSIVLDKASTLEAGFSTIDIADNAGAIKYRDKLRAEQATVQAAIESKLGGKLDVAWNLTLAANIISANVRYRDIAAIEAVPGVKSVYVERQYAPDVVSVGGTLDPNMAVAGELHGAHNAWDAGYTGEGTLIAIIDTGLDLDHQSFDNGAFLYAVDEDGERNLKLTEEDVIAAAASGWLNVTGSYSATAAGLYHNEKVPFGWNYIDDSDDITHDNDGEGEHGSHVAGIAAANRYVDTDGDGKYEEALKTVMVAGNAPDAQFLIMKVFGKNGGAYDSDCVAAIEDAIILGADAVNLSLGMALPGFATPAPNSPYVGIQKILTGCDTVVVYSAGNAGSWADNTYNGYLYSDGVSYQFDGESGSYTNSFTVASVDNDGFAGSSISVGDITSSFNDGAFQDDPRTDLASFASLDTSSDGSGTKVPFLMVAKASRGQEPTVLAELADELKGKVAIVWRGSINFSLKAQAASDNGAIGAIIANVPNPGEAPGLIPVLDGYTGDAPVSSVNEPIADAIWAAYAGQVKTTASGVQYIVGEMVVSASSMNLYNSGYYTMSSFSSWGAPGNLSLKPEISAFGGSIYSVNGADLSGTAYELMSGTSMAAPQVTGMSAVVQQYLRTNPDLIIPADITTRALTMSLLMATAEPMKDEYGYYYSLLQQGAGLANVEKAVSSPVYITVTGQDDGKVKAEVGDDPDRTGVFTFEFDIHNLVPGSYTYALSADVFTQALFSVQGYGDFMDYYTDTLDALVFFKGADVVVSNEVLDLRYDFDQDGDVDEDDAQLLLDHIILGTEIEGYEEFQLDVDGNFCVDTHDVHELLNLLQPTVVVQDVTHVTAEIVLDKDAAEALDEAKNGTGFYVEAFVNVTPRSDDGTMYPKLTIPMLGYYGNWTDPSMYEIGSNTDWYNTYSNSRPVDGRYPYTFRGAGQTTYNLAVTNIVYKGAYAATPAKANLMPDGTLAGIGESTLSYRYTPIRNYGNGVVQVTDSKGNLLWRSEDFGQGYGVLYYENAGFWIGVSGGSLIYNLSLETTVNWAAAMKNVDPDVDTVYISLILAPEYYEQYGYDWDALTDGDNSNGELGKGAILTTKLELDQEPPVIVSVEETTAKTDETGKGRILTAELTDNKGLAKAVLYDENYVVNRTSNPVQTLTISGTSATVTFDGGDLRFGGNVLTDKPLPDSIYRLEVTDASGNMTSLRFPVGDVSFTEYVGSVELSYDELSLIIGSSDQLEAVVGPYNLVDGADGVTWSSSDESIVTVDENGVINAVGKGDATITATTVGTNEAGEHLTATCEVNVYGIPVTATGVLGDENGYAKFFEYNFDEGMLSYKPDEKSETIYPVAVTPIDGNSYFTLDDDYTIYQVGYDGKVIASASGTDYTGFYINDIAYASADEALFWTAKGQSYLLMEEDPFDPQLSGWNLSSYWAARTYGYPTLLAVQNEAWEDSGYSGDYMLWILYTGATQSFALRCDMVSGGAGFLMTMYPLGINLAYAGYNGESYSNMVVGDDGALYISLMTGDTNEVIRVLLEDGDAGSFYRTMNYLGDFGDGVWPGLFLEVHTNETIDNAADKEKVSMETVTVKVDASSAETISTERALAIMGSLNSIEIPETDDDAAETNGVVVDTEAGTVTVPVYASASTNGEFILNYDPEIMHFESAEEGDLLVSYVVDEEAGTIHVGYADEDEADTVVLTVVFSIDKEAGKHLASIALDVLQDGTDKTESTTETEVEFHSWTAEFVWSADGKSATATLTCEYNTEHTETVEATVTGEVKEGNGPTCTEDGTTTYTATVEYDGQTFTDTKDVVDVRATGHTEYRVDVTLPTCTKDGKAEVYCKVCNELLYTEVIPATGEHVCSEATVTEATCEEDGSVILVCDDCGETFQTVVIPATGHAWKVEFTWSEDGKTAKATFTCEHDETHTETVDATVTSEVKTPATETEDGTTTYTATVEFNGETYTDTKDVKDIPATGADDPGTSDDPSTPDDPHSPETGDNSNFALWAALILLSVFGLYAIIMVPRKALDNGK